MNNELESLQKQMENTDEMIPIVIFDNGMSFGELALLSKKPRAGTVLTLTDCYFAVINAQDFDKLLKKDKALKISNNITFLRQVPYIRNWLIKDTNGLLLISHEQKAEVRGKIILREGDPCRKVIIIISGEVEIIKQDLSSIYYNDQTGVLGIKEGNKKATMLQSKVVNREIQAKTLADFKKKDKDGVVSKKARYTGTDFYMIV